MAKKDFGKGTEEWMMFVEFWQLCKDYWIPENEDSYWDELIQKSNDFAEKYKDIINGDLAKNLVIAFCESRDKAIKTK